MIREIEPTFPLQRLCFKITATAGGLLACGTLQDLGIRTMAQGVFCIEQAFTAVDIGTSYIAINLHERFSGPIAENHGRLQLAHLTKLYCDKTHNRHSRVVVANFASDAEVLEQLGAERIALDRNIILDLESTPLRPGAAEGEAALRRYYEVAMLPSACDEYIRSYRSLLSANTALSQMVENGDGGEAGRSMQILVDNTVRDQFQLVHVMHRVKEAMEMSTWVW
jgi:hypothetical protein